MRLWKYGHASVALEADGRRLVLDADTGQAFPIGIGLPTVSCARSSIDDRFTFVFASGATLIRQVDTAPLTMSKAPDPILDPATLPLAAWRGLPAVWR